MNNQVNPKQKWLWTFSLCLIVSFIKVDSQSIWSGTSFAHYCNNSILQHETHLGCESGKANIASEKFITEATRRDLLDRHNLIRSRVKPPAMAMAILTWDDTLAKFAQKWGNLCRHNQGQYHTDNIRFLPDLYDVGQNIYFEKKNDFTIEKAVAEWKNTLDDYKYGRNLVADPNAKVNKGLQLIWAQTLQIGCAMTLCFETQLLVCNYGPGINLTTERLSMVNTVVKVPYEIEEVLSPIRNRCKNTEDNLCSCPNRICRNGGTLNFTSCTCTCRDLPYLIQDKNCRIDCDLAKSNSTHTDWTQACNQDSDLQEMWCNRFKTQVHCPNMCGFCYEKPSKALRVTPNNAVLLVLVLVQLALTRLRSCEA